MKNFFNLVNKKREQDAGLQPKPDAPKPAEGPQPSQSDFFYGSPADLRKRKPK